MVMVGEKSIKEKIGTLSKKKMDEVHEGLKFVLTFPLLTFLASALLNFCLYF